MSKARDLANAGTALGAVDATELGYLDGVTSAVQTQINSKIGQSTAINPSTVTTKGDILAATGSGTIVRQGVGTNGQVLTADSAEADGIKWATPSSGAITKISTTTVSGSTVTISSIPTTYTRLYLTLDGIFTSAGGGYDFKMTFNGDSSAIYRYGTVFDSTSIVVSSQQSPSGTSGNYLRGVIEIVNANQLSPRIGYYSNAVSNANGQAEINRSFMYNSSAAAITSITFTMQTVTFSGGTITLYGIA
jgi:hypothetical protein